MGHSYCNICGKEIPDYNITNSCKRCFNSFARRKNKYGDWEVTRHWEKDKNGKKKL